VLVFAVLEAAWKRRIGEPPGRFPRRIADPSAGADYRVRGARGVQVSLSVLGGRGVMRSLSAPNKRTT
jgi:hypothetical protein